MMEYNRPRISVLEPLGPAIEHVKNVLFRPFDLQRWLAIGFCAWLAQLGTGGGGGNSGIRHQQNGSGGEFNGEQLRHFLEEAQVFLSTNASWLIPLAVGIVAVGMMIWLLVLWLSSRGHFMLLYNVIYNTAEVKRPWHMLREYGHSLFLFRVCLSLIGGTLTLILLGVSALVMLSSWPSLELQTLWHLAWIVPVFILTVTTLGLIESFTKNFVTPLMIKRATYCVPAWQEFRGLLSANLGRFILFALFKGMINLLIGIMIVMLGLMTCCCGFVLLAVPFLGTLILLPLHVFDRAYPLYYLRQYGVNYDLLTEASTQRL